MNHAYKKKRYDFNHKDYVKQLVLNAFFFLDKAHKVFQTFKYPRLLLLTV